MNNFLALPVFFAPLCEDEGGAFDMFEVSVGVVQRSKMRKARGLKGGRDQLCAMKAQRRMTESAPIKFDPTDAQMRFPRSNYLVNSNDPR